MKTLNIFTLLSASLLIVGCFPINSERNDFESKLSQVNHSLTLLENQKKDPDSNELLHLKHEIALLKEQNKGKREDRDESAKKTKNTRESKSERDSMCDRERSRDITLCSAKVALCELRSNRDCYHVYDSCIEEVLLCDVDVDQVLYRRKYD